MKHGGTEGTEKSGGRNFHRRDAEGAETGGREAGFLGGDLGRGFGLFLACGRVGAEGGGGGRLHPEALADGALAKGDMAVQGIDVELIVSDYGISEETGNDTDFIVVTP